MKNIYLVTSLIITIFTQTHLFATHNRAGEIIYTQMDSYTIEAQIITYTKTSSAAADRDSLQICWGDGLCEYIDRSNGDGEILPHDQKRNIYTGQHTYAEFGNYILSMTDPNRNHGILNVNPPLSDNVVFYIETQFTLSEEIDHSPVLLQAPIDIAFLGTPFLHTPNAYDPDGDSIAYELAVPLEANDMEVPNYFELTEIEPENNNTLTFNEDTGLLVWNAPQLAGEYNIAIKVKSFRNGELLGSVLRDMQILVMPEGNPLPMISTDNFGNDNTIYNMTPNEDVNFQIFANGATPQQILTLSSSSELYETPLGNITFTVNEPSDNNIQATFDWHTHESYIREQPYQLVFKVQDDSGLANFKIIRFRVRPVVSVDQVNEEETTYPVYPNPARDFILYNNIFTKHNEYTILNANGQSVLNGKLTSDVVKIEITNLPSGTYYIKVDNFSGRTFIKH